jgi:hypothetical protein
MAAVHGPEIILVLNLRNNNTTITACVYIFRGIAGVNALICAYLDCVGEEHLNSSIIHVFSLAQGRLLVYYRMKNNLLTSTVYCRSKIVLVRPTRFTTTITGRLGYIPVGGYDTLDTCIIDYISIAGSLQIIQ